MYVDIFLGKIKAWDDLRIQRINPDLKLPRQDIALVVRQDGSGTTYAFTNHLSAISEEWRDRGPGIGRRLQWQGGAMTAAAATVEEMWRKRFPLGQDGVRSSSQLPSPSIAFGNDR